MSTNYLQMLKKVDKLPIYTDLDTLDIYCEYLLNDSNHSISFSSLSNLKDYVDMMDPKILMTNDAKMARYEFIRLYLEGRLDRGVVKRNLCLSYVDDNIEPKYRKVVQRDIINSIEPDRLGKKDIEFINDMVFAQLNTQFMHKYKLGMTKMIDDLNNNEFGKTGEDCTNAIQFMQTVLNDLMKAQRRSKQDNRFNLTDATHFKAVMSEAWDRLLSDNQFLKTGWYALNSMLNGGFENARVYNFIGATGGFKSGLLLNIMKTVKLHNKGRVHKDSNKRPTILFLSQENNIWETIARIFGIFASTTNMRNYTVDQIMDMLSEGGFRLVEDELDIDIEFRYYGNMDIGVPDIRGIVEELDNSGREVIMVIQDYIERLRPPLISADKRTQLIDVSNQLHDLAIELDIPIATASQFNRSGAGIIEDMRAAERHDIGKNVGMQNVSESYGMLKNFDANISIVIEYDKVEGRFYLSFRQLKYRGDDSESITYFLQPFVGKNSKIQLMEDIDQPQPLYRLSLLDELELQLQDERTTLMEHTATRMTLPEDELQPVTQDPDELDRAAFLYSMDADLRRAEMKQNFIKNDPAAQHRNSDGYLEFTTIIPKEMLPLMHKNKLRQIDLSLGLITEDDINKQQADDFKSLYRHTDKKG